MLNTRLGLHSSSPAAKLFLVLLLLQLSLPAVAQEFQLVYPRNLNRLGELIVPAVDSILTLCSVSPEVSA
nr:hypothetical protein [bacterium]